MFTRRRLSYATGGPYAHCIKFFTDTEHGYGHDFNEESTPEKLKGECG